MKKLGYLYIAVMGMLLTSCFKEDEPVPAYISPEGVEVGVAEMKPDYSMQVYYDLETNSMVASNHREDWDLALSCEVGHTTIYLNSAKKMRAKDLQTSSWTTTVNTQDTTGWRHDFSSGEAEKTVLFNMSANVHAIDLGLSTLGTSLGYKKIRLASSTEQQVVVEYANMDGANQGTFTLTKDADHNFVYFSFKNGGAVVSPEPMKNRYDLLFSYYTTRLHDGSGYIWYPVTGVLLNPNGVGVAIDSTDNFTGITYQDLEHFTFSENRDVIGHAWKVYDITAGVYTILVKNTYIIRDRSSNFWKIRFTGFTNASGERGYPTFELGKF